MGKRIGVIQILRKAKKLVGGWVQIPKCLLILTLSMVDGSKKPKCLRMLTLSMVGGSKKTLKFTDSEVVVEGGSEIFKPIRK